MASEWFMVPLGEFISLQRGHDLPDERRVLGNVPVIGSFGITGWHNEAKAKAPGLTIGRSGVIGGANYLEVDFFPLNTTLYVTDFHGNHPRFAYYFAKNFDFSSFNSGSVQPSLNRNFLNPVPVVIPPVCEQKAIAHILGTLDDKIELNRKTNETLEAIAKALFKSWFVNFDPVRAKAEGRPTGLPAEISDLFPDSFEKSELGEIPRGWKVETLGEHVELTKGRSYKSSELNPSRIALVTLKSFQRKGGYKTEGLKSFTGTYRPEQEVKAGEIIVALTDVTQRAEVIGKPAIVESDSRYDKLVASLDVGIVRPKRGGIGSTPYLYNLMLTSDYSQYSLGYTSGTTVLHLNHGAINNYPTVIPSLNIVNTYDCIAQAILSNIDCSRASTKSLEFLRNTLLPKLISGEQRVPDAEALVAEAGL